jgi:hypothetical protein
LHETTNSAKKRKNSFPSTPHGTMDKKTRDVAGETIKQEKQARQEKQDNRVMQNFL